MTGAGDVENACVFPHIYTSPATVTDKCQKRRVTPTFHLVQKAGQVRSGAFRELVHKQHEPRGEVRLHRKPQEPQLEHFEKDCIVDRKCHHQSQRKYPQSRKLACKFLRGLTCGRPQLLYCWQEECSFVGRVICKRRDPPRSLQERMGSSSPERNGQRILGRKC